MRGSHDYHIIEPDAPKSIDGFYPPMLPLIIRKKKKEKNKTRKKRSLPISKCLNTAQ
jgi:hypothetical protein